MQHLLKNLAYFDPEGRLQLLETMSTLIERFPAKLLDNYTEMFFLSLFLRVVNDDDSKCRE
jgi:hypothetical protein